MWKQIAVVLKYQKKKILICEGGLEMVEHNTDNNVVQCG
jgi:hypothetical protein